MSEGPTPIEQTLRFPSDPKLLLLFVNRPEFKEQRLSPNPKDINLKFLSSILRMVAQEGSLIQMGRERVVVALGLS